MKINAFLSVLICFSSLSAQKNNLNTVRDAFTVIATDAIAAGQADIGVATTADTFSQFWNPSKYIFSDKKFELGLTRILGNSNQFNNFNQLNLSYYCKIDNRSAYSIGFRGYSYDINNLRFVETNLEGTIDGSYTLRLGNTFAMSVSGRYILLQGKISTPNDFNEASSLYGVDVSGFYYGKEIAYKKFNGRWRAGFNFSNLRGESSNDNREIEIYAPSTLRIGTGFDFIFNQDTVLSITTEYKTLLDSYVENANGEALDFGIEGSVIALGLELQFREKIITRAGYSLGINRPTDSFVSVGIGLQTKKVDFNFAYLFMLSEEENLLRENVRLSLSFNLEEILFISDNN